MKKSGKEHSIAVKILPLAVILLLAVGALLYGANRWVIQIDILGDQTQYVEYGAEFEDPGAAAVRKGSIFSFIRKDLQVKTASNVDPEKTGTYSVVYSAADGSSRETASRTVIIQDTVPPEIKLKSDPDAYTLPGHEYEEEGYTASDNYDGDLTDRVDRQVKDGTVVYTVTDSSGNKASVARTIVYDDRTAPELTLEGGDQTITQGGSFEDSYTAIDDADGDITDRVTVDGTVDTETPGDYVLKYEVADSYGNKSQAQRTVTVSPKPAGDKVIYLTFDDGPGPYTARLLDVLAQYDVKATFFVTHAFPDYEDMLAREAAEGHTVAVHTYSHDYDLIYSSADAYWEDFEEMEQVIEAQTGKRTTMFRFPGGSSNTVSNFNPGIMTYLTQDAAARGYTYFDWNVSSGDASNTVTGSEVYQNILRECQMYKENVVLCHDVKSYTVDIIDDVIEWGLANGYVFAPLTPDSYTAHHGVAN